MFIILIFVFVVTSKGEWIKKMENERLFQGDIDYHYDNGYGSIVGGRWPNAVVPYDIDDNAHRIIKLMLPRAIAEYEKYTCLRFKKRTTEQAYLHFQDGAGCSSPVGYRKGKVNPVTLNWGCGLPGVIMHEIGHSLGLYHEQSRPDRDSYVEIITENIKKGMAYNFDKAESSIIDSLGTPYDYLSMMHYGATAFGKDNKMTIKTKDPVFQDKIGNRIGFSEIDKVQINKMYCGGVMPTWKPEKKTTAEPAKCEDILNAPCDYYVKNNFCRRSSIRERTCCKSCKGGTVIRTNRPPWTNRPIWTTKPTEMPGTCIDEVNFACNYFVTNGYCKTMKSIRKRCCKSCKGGNGRGTKPTYQPIRTSEPVRTYQPRSTNSPSKCADTRGKPCYKWRKSCFVPYIRRNCCKTCQGSV